MKHIKKRFLIQEKKENVNFNHDKAELINLSDGECNDNKLVGKKNFIAFLQTKEDLIIGGFIHKVNGRNYVFPVPDPTLIYFNNAQTSLKTIKERKALLLKKLDLAQPLNEPALNEIYNFYGITSAFIIFLFTAIESFINQQIPDDFVYVNKGHRRTEHYDKNQIQEFVDFKTKITKVLNEASGKNFFQKATPTNQIIWKLKEFRDDIVHTKQDAHPLHYEGLIKSSLNFKYDKALLAVAKFMNHYMTNYITECDCGVDF